jgi:hypothetical protein
MKAGDKLFVVSCGDLSPGAQACQGVHAAIAFTHEHPEIEQDWYENSNYLAFLTVEDEREL